MEAENGVPSVALHTHAFARVAKSTARLRGIPTLRQAFVPQPVVGRTASELRGYIEDLQQSGFDVVRLKVQLQKKVAFPLITFVMAMLAIPFLGLIFGMKNEITR